MPAHDFEIEEAMQEGVMIKWLSTIKQAGDHQITVEKMALDDKGFPQPTGEFETLEADSVVLALGQDVDLGLLNGVPGLEVTKDGVVKVGADMMTGHPGIFAGGDMVPAERNVTVGVGHGKKAAKNIDAWLRGTTYAPPPKHTRQFEKLNTWYYADAPKTVRPMLDIIRRQSTFEEVQGGLDESTALFEARRCLSCGNCFECDNCYGVCPDNAVIKLGPGKRFQFNYDYCKGCGMCVRRGCPCGAIESEKDGYQWWRRRSEDEAGALLRDVALVTGRHGIGAHRAFSAAVALEPLVAPAAGRCIFARVAMHDTDHLARTFDDGVIGRLRLEQVEHYDGAVSPFPRLVTRHGGLVRVKMVNAAERVVKPVTGIDDHRLDMVPVAVALRIRHRVCIRCANGTA
jgi:Pyruvate/2-oxoacid:ferredoxin oxidoreductase delta subunit